jgi:arsenate reductase (glutaredoxin)
MNTLFGIKNCDTVKKARRWLEDNHIHYQFHDLRNDGINREQVTQWIHIIGIDTLINKRSTTWKTLSDSHKIGLDAASADALILEHPTLIKRPLLTTESGAYVGFSDTHYRTIFK